jgi:hypothetical protein
MHALGRFNRSSLGALLVAASAMVGCSNDNLAPKMIPTPSGPMADMGTVMVHVNLKTGAITTHPVTSGSLRAPSGVSAAYYGASALIGHRFQLEGGSGIGPNTYVLRDHIENLEPFAIGTHVAHAVGAFPQDTMGAYVFLTIGPVVTAGCTASPTCTVALDTAYDGTFSFTAPDQQYMYFKTILEPNDNHPDEGLDFTDQSPANHGAGIDYFRKFGFRATPGVTDFVFGVSVSAAWVKPNENSWTVHYTGDSLPTRGDNSLDSLRSDPDWRVVGSKVADTSIAVTFCPLSGNCLSIRHAAPTTGVTDSLLYFRSDSLGQTDSAYIDAFIALSNLRPGNPSVYMAMQDPVKLISFGIASDKVGFTTGVNTFLASSITSTSSVASGEFRVAKFGTDSVLGYVNGARKAKVLYSALPNVSASTPPRYFWFGNRVTFTSGANPTNVTSNWSSVVYGIGATSP